MILGRPWLATTDACIQAFWLQGILSEFDLGSTLSTVLFCDNQSAIKISTDLVTRKRKSHFGASGTLGLDSIAL